MEETEEKKNKKAKKVKKQDNKKETKPESKKEESKKEKKAEKTHKQEEKTEKTKKKEKKPDKKEKALKKDNSKKEAKSKLEKKTKEKTHKQETSEEIPENIEVFSINLSVLILLFAILLIIIAIIVYAYNKDTNKPSNEIDVDEVVENQVKSTKAVEFDTEEQVGKIKGYLRYKSIAMSSPESLLETFGLITNQKFLTYPKNSDNTFVQTDISYEAIRKEFQFYITKDFFASEFKNIYKPSNGVTYVANIEKSREDYEVKGYERVSTKGKPIVQVWYVTKVDGVESEQKTMKVEFSTYNGRWLISSIK